MSERRPKKDKNFKKSRSHGGRHRPQGKSSAQQRITSERKRDLVLAKTAAGMDVIGIFQKLKDGSGIVYPADKTLKDHVLIQGDMILNAKSDDLVVATLMPKRAGQLRGRVKEILGHKDEPKLISLLVIHNNQIPHFFPHDALKDVETAVVPSLGTRTDLTGVPLVTIDGLDARDFDDAVFAEPDQHPSNKGGYHLIVAIADVAHYLKTGTALDDEAIKRGNSTYFPDRVVPMLPERLSNDLCSLRPHEPRASLAVHLWINDKGELIRHKFVRALIKSRARLTYEQVQAAYDGHTDDITRPILDNVIKPLYEAFRLLYAARKTRGALELDMPERKVKLAEDGHIVTISKRARLDSHMLIEEMMILANVASALELEKHKAPCVYRIHPPPDPAKLEATREFLSELGFNLQSTAGIRPHHINQILLKSAETDAKELIHTVILRTQSQAVYSPDNIGHFGLALQKYAHFTSPIRRYADVLVHRSLIRALRLGDDGLNDDELNRLDQISEHISQTERRSMIAEREANDRYTSYYLADKTGATFAARISSVTHFGLFITLEETGGDGIIPLRLLPDDYYIHDEANHALIGKATKRIYRMSAPITVRLLEADAIKGSTIFEPADDFSADIAGFTLIPKNVKARKGKESAKGHKGKNISKRPKRRKK
jgi:ribonuclease R